MLFAYVKIPKFWSNVTTSGDIIKNGKKESYLNWMKEKKHMCGALLRVKKALLVSNVCRLPFTEQIIRSS